METYYINGYRIAARSFAQAIESARQLKQGEYPFNWPGEHRYSPVFNPTPVAFVGKVDVNA